MKTKTWLIIGGGVVGLCLVAVCTIAVVVIILNNGNTSATSDQTPSGAVTATVPLTKENAQYVDPRQLASDPKAYVGQVIYLQGRAIKVTQYDKYTWVQLAAVPRGENLGDASVFEFTPKNSNIIALECYRFYGLVKGTQTVKSDLTGSSSQMPLLQGFDLEEKPLVTSTYANLTSCDGPE